MRNLIKYFIRALPGYCSVFPKTTFTTKNYANQKDTILSLKLHSIIDLPESNGNNEFQLWTTYTQKHKTCRSKVRQKLQYKDIKNTSYHFKIVSRNPLILATFSAKRYFILTYWFIFTLFLIKISVKVTKTTSCKHFYGNFGKILSFGNTGVFKYLV